MAMQEEGLDIEAARQRIWLMDSAGLVTTDREARKDPHKEHFAKEAKNSKDLLDVVTSVKPTCLIGLYTLGSLCAFCVIRNFFF